MNGLIRCAIYTRKSSEEGLEQSFNWLHAGKIDTVVVYKVDRLTRSLADFAKIVEFFDSKQVSFVSVTQQFNTTTSMGRLTLNVLLSFAQFEREVTGERIRDKVAASKAKGMWMGGTIPLGYDLQGKKLLINEEEAELVREICREYLQIGSVAGLKEYLDHRERQSKPRSLKAGKTSGGARFWRGALYRLLSNHLYIGEVAHNGNVYKGEHEAIVDREQWLEVQRRMADNRQGPKRRQCRSNGSLLTGVLVDSEGNRMTPTHSNKTCKRYRYYTSQSVIKKKRSVVALTRIPAPDLEQAVLMRASAFLNSADDLLTAAKNLKLLGRPLEAFFQTARQRADWWEGQPSEGREELARSALVKVVVFDERIEISLRLSYLLDWSWNHESVGQQEGDLDAGPNVITLTCPFSQVRRDQELRLFIDGAEPTLTTSTTALLKGVARARLWYEQLVSGEIGSIPELAEKNGITPRYMKNILRAAMLGPEGVEALLAGKCSTELTLNGLVNDLPSDWARQCLTSRASILDRTDHISN